jgi:hypothetical protein
MTSFKEILLRTVGPRLSDLGYKYEERLRDRNLRYGFQKPLGEGVYATIVFQRQLYEERARSYGFTVELTRGVTTDFRRWSLYDGSLAAGLGAVLWFVYKLRLYESYNHDWSASSAEECKPQLLDAFANLEKYGIPWLEDPLSRIPWEAPRVKQDEFRELILNTAAPELEQLGYQIKEIHDVKLYYFTKRLPQRLNVFIEFQQIYHMEPEWFEIDVLLQRKVEDDPHQYTGRFSDGWLDARLGKVLWHIYEVYPTEFNGWEAGLKEMNGEFVKVRVPPHEAFTWRYHDHAGLEKQFADILDKIKKYAIPWLEDPTSQNP